MEDHIAMWKITGGRELLERLKPYRMVLLVLGAGILLMLLPSGSAAAETAETEASAEQSEELWLADVQRELADTLSRIEGAGQLTLMLSVETGMQRQLARDSESELREDESSTRRETVILSSAGGGEEVVVTRSGYPVFRGAVVVCEGGDVPAVRLAITEAVTALTGLGSDKISVIKGNVK